MSIPQDFWDNLIDIGKRASTPDNDYEAVQATEDTQDSEYFLMLARTEPTNDWMRIYQEGQ